MSSPTIDGSATGTATIGPMISASLTTAHAGDLIVAVVYNEPGGVPPPKTVTGVSATGLSFTRRAQSNGSTYGCLEIWTAQATGALSALSITATLSGTFDDGSMIVFGVNGATAGAPFDPNVSLPLKLSQSANSYTPSFTLNTSNSADLLIWAMGAGRGPVNLTPAGWTNVATANNGGGTYYSYLVVAYTSVSAVQSGVTVTSSASDSSSLWSDETILDAFTAGGGSGATITFRRTRSQLGTRAGSRQRIC